MWWAPSFSARSLGKQVGDNSFRLKAKSLCRRFAHQSQVPTIPPGRTQNPQRKGWHMSNSLSHTHTEKEINFWQSKPDNARPRNARPLLFSLLLARASSAPKYCSTEPYTHGSC